MAIDPSAVGERLHRAYAEADPVASAFGDDAATVADGYEAQRAFVDRRLPAEGPAVGYKVGFTTEAVRADVGVDRPVFGRVLADTVLSGDRIDVGPLIAPRIEPEIAFLLDDALEPPVTPFDVLGATQAVVPTVEVVDSRVRDWDVTAAGAVADNALAARVLPGRQTGAVDRDLGLEGVRVRVDGEVRGAGTGAAVLGHPARAVAWLAEALAGHDERLAAGDAVLTGSITEPIPVAPGETLTVEFASLGTVTAGVVRDGSP
ncbi:MAG: 2-keto-4-pentenoate hydratase [Haloferacaceae archaeon]